jgi:hypothetical protein
MNLTLIERKKIELKLTEKVLEIFNLKNSVKFKKSFGGKLFLKILKKWYLNIKN